MTKRCNSVFHLLSLPQMLPEPKLLILVYRFIRTFVDMFFKIYEKLINGITSTDFHQIYFQLSDVCFWIVLPSTSS